MRYLAEWCSSYGPQEGPDFDPDLCIYKTEVFETQKEASEHAEKMAANGPTDDWWKVREQEYIRYMYRGVDIGQWETVATWISDEYIGA